MDPGAIGRTRSEPEVNRPPTRPKPGSRNTFSSPRGGESNCKKTPKTRTPKKHQKPSSKHQKNSKLQTPRKSQTSVSKRRLWPPPFANNSPVSIDKRDHGD